MTGGVYRLKVKGPQDFFLTGNPQHNFISQVYLRHYNFSSEIFSLNFDNGDGDYSKKLEISIPRKGDYIRKMYLQLTLGNLVKTSGMYAGWTNSVGHAIIDYVDLIIGGTIIDRQYGLYMNIHDELYDSSGINSAEGLLVGRYSHIGSLERSGLSDSKYIIPLKFWFCENTGSSLPLYKLSYQTVKISIKLRNFDECIVYDGLTPPTGGFIKETKLLVEYMYIDEVVRKKDLDSKSEVLITQVQSLYGEELNGKFFNSILEFNHPCSELVFVLREDQNEKNNDWFNFSVRNINIATPVRPILKYASLFADNREIMEKSDEFTLRILNGLRYRKFSTNKHIYTISFADDLTKWYPNGTLNFSMISTPKLAIVLNDYATDVTRLYIFVKNFNVVTFNNGMLSLSYSN